MTRFLALFALVSSLPAAVQIELHFPVLEQALSQQAFTADGKKYVRGNAATKCSYAYLASPRLSGSNGRLNVETRFSGRSAVDVFGSCVGLGGDFDLTILATPYYVNGKLALKQVLVDSRGRDSLYIRRVCKALAESIEREFSYPIHETARKILEERREIYQYKHELATFNVPEVRVTPYAVVLTVDFTLAVRMP